MVLGSCLPILLLEGKVWALFSNETAKYNNHHLGPRLGCFHGTANDTYHKFWAPSTPGTQFWLLCHLSPIVALLVAGNGTHSRTLMDLCKPNCYNNLEMSLFCLVRFNPICLLGHTSNGTHSSVVAPTKIHFMVIVCPSNLVIAVSHSWGLPSVGGVPWSQANRTGSCVGGVMTSFAQGQGWVHMKARVGSRS